MTSETITDYVGGYEYMVSSNTANVYANVTNSLPSRIHHTEGAVTKEGSSNVYQYEFALRDHLGNTRVTFKDKNNDATLDNWSTDPNLNEIAQINHYYPFGLNMEGNWNGANGANKYQYNGKEWDVDLGTYDYGFRSYDPAVGRWWVPEPLIDFYPEISPYVYAMNNPIIMFDVMGFQTDSIKPAPGGLIPNWPGFNPDQDEALLPEVLVTDTKPEKKEKEEEPASGVSEDSAARYIPVVGSGLDAYDAFSRGNYWSGAGHTLMAISDVFLVKSIVTGIGKAVIRKGLIGGTKNYFGIGMSHTYGATTKRLTGLGVNMSGYKHHWAISQSLMKRYPFLLPIGNQSWNLTRFGSQASHVRWAHGQNYLGVAPPSLWKIWYPISSVPEFVKLGIYPRLLGNYLIDEDEQH